MNKGWVFPYNDIPAKSKIIIYGAGDVGSNFFFQNDATDYCKLVLWVDAQFDFYKSKGMSVEDPLLINEYEYDYVLIAVDSPRISESIYSFLEDLKVPSNKIWSPYVKVNKERIEKQKTIHFQIDKSYLERKPDLSNLKIAFIIPEPIKGGGGHRNIFRAVKKMMESGHDVDVYCVNSSFTIDEIKENVREWFYDLSEVNFVSYHDEMEMGVYDVGIATWWETVYIIKKYNENFRSIICFTQDYEPFFYPLSSSYILAENTYKLGYKYLCSGPWCEKILKEKFNADAVSFQFPIDRKIYNDTYTKKSSNRNIVFFAKPEMPRRCYEIGIKALEIFHEKKPDIEIILFGSKVLNSGQVPFKATIRNIVPTLEGLAQMYTDADLGIVFSVTNPSLVPYEMMSCGCPVVDLNVEFAISKYGDDENNVFLLDPMPEIFADELCNIIDDAELLEKKSKHAMEWVKREFPSETEMGEFIEQTIISVVKDNIYCTK